MTGFVHPGLISSDYGVHEVGVTVCGIQHVLWVLGVWIWPGTHIIMYAAWKIKVESKDIMKRNKKRMTLTNKQRKDLWKCHNIFKKLTFSEHDKRDISPS